MLVEQEKKKKKEKVTSSLSIDFNREDPMEQNWSDHQPPFQMFLTSSGVFILPKETYQRGDEFLILMAETYVDEDENVHQGPSRGKFVILKQNQSPGSVQLVSTEGVGVEDP
jgi:hypothetical protein